MRRLIAGLTVLFGMAGFCQSARAETSSMVDEIVTYTRNIDKDIGGSDGVSVQIVYSSANASAVTFTDGKVSTGSITISSYTALIGSKALATITISSYTWLATPGIFEYVTINGTRFTVGVDFAVGTSAPNMAANLGNEISRQIGKTIEVYSVAGTSVYMRAMSSGTYGNAFAIESSSPAALSISGSNFSGGKDHATLNIGNQLFVSGTDFTPVTSNAVTSKSISDAIMANVVLNRVLRSTWSAAGIITATTTIAGSFGNFELVSSTPAAMTVFASRMYGGTDSDIYINTPTVNGLNVSSGYYYPGTPIRNSINKATSQWGTGLPVLLGVTAGTAPLPLVNKTTYYAMNISSNTGFQLSTTSTGAVAGNAITITTMTETGAGTFTLTPIAMAGTPVFKLQASNDGSNFSDLYISSMTTNYSFSAVNSSPCSVSFASPYASSSIMWNLGKATFKTLRLVFTKGTWGGVNLKTILNSEK